MTSESLETYSEHVVVSGELVEHVIQQSTGVTGADHHATSKRS